MRRLSPAAASSDRELRSFLQITLPSYLLPTLFVYQQALPPSPKGKVDCGALPQLDEPREARAALAPRDELERQLVQIWTEILRLPSIGVRDTFFDLRRFSPDHSYAVDPGAHHRQTSALIIPI